MLQSAYKVILWVFIMVVTVRGLIKLSVSYTSLQH